MKTKKNLITALKKLYTAFGGNEEVKDNAVDIVDKIADQVEEGGSSGSDNGVYYVTFTLNEDDEFVPDKSIEEMTQALNDGMYLVAIVMINGIFPRYCPLSTFTKNRVPIFCGVSEDRNFITVIYAEDKWNVDSVVLVVR